MADRSQSHTDHYVRSFYDTVSDTEVETWTTVESNTKYSRVSVIIQMYAVHISSRLPALLTEADRIMLRWDQETTTNVSYQILTLHSILVSFDAVKA